MASPFNAAAARAKRPCPLWVDAFLRDTQHLSADEVGAYMLILMVMWSRESCDYPDDDHRLARVCRVSMRLWKSRLSPTIRPFFRSSDGMLISKRLREEAAYVERQCKAQSDRKLGENPDNSLKDNDPRKTADTPRNEPTGTSPDHPSQQPNLLREGKPSLAHPPIGEGAEEPIPTPADPPAPKPRPAGRFAEFWQAYPHRGGLKKGRAPAEKRFIAAVRRGVPAEAIIAGAKAAHQHPDVVRGYARDPATWLNQEGWLDEFGSGASGSKPGYWTSMGYIPEAVE